MYIVSFHPRFNESAIFLSKRLNIPFILHLSPKEGDIIIIFGSSEKSDQLLYIQESLKLKYLLIQSEPYYSDVFDNKYYSRLIQQNCLLDYSRYNSQFLKERIPVKIYTFYFYEFMLHKDTTERKYDILLLGDTKRSDEYKRLNPSCKYAPTGSDPHALLTHLKETKYVLIMPAKDKEPFDMFNVHRGLTAGCQVVCQRGADLQTEKKYANYIHLEQNILDFSWLLEKEPTQTYTELMDEFGYFEVENNLKQIIFAAKSLDVASRPEPTVHKIEEEVISQKNKKNGDSSIQVQPSVEPAHSELRSNPSIRRTGTASEPV